MTEIANSPLQVTSKVTYLKGSPDSEMDCLSTQMDLFYLDNDEDFETIKELGEGVFSYVRLCKSKANQSSGLYVVKYCVRSRIRYWVRSKAIRIPMEVSILMRINGHPNIMKMEKFAQDDFFFKIISRYVPNTMDLFDFISKNSPNERRIQGIMRQVLEAVRHIHSHGVIHRDIKDENILIGDNDHITLIDFGSAIYASNGPFHIYEGTSRFEPPEILQSKDYEGKPQDMWQVGILLYLLLYGKIPFRTENEIIQCKFDVPSTFSPECTDFLCRLLCKDVNGRIDVDDALKDPWIINGL